MAILFPYLQIRNAPAAWHCVCEVPDRVNYPGFSSSGRFPFFMPEIRTILATDCGSTTTKAILIEKQGEEYRLTTRGEAPTTVEAPFDDVTVGVTNAVREVEELSGRTILDEQGKIITPTAGDGKGVDLYLSTSSA